MSRTRATRVSLAGRTAIARSAVYAFLARSLAYPDEQQLTVVRSELVPILHAVRTEDAALSGALAAALAEVDAPLDELRTAHGALFPPVGQSELCVYESVYRTRDLFQEAETLADIAGFYRAHGLVVGGVERERPDHLAVELEFMAFLARKRAFALAELGRARANSCRLAEAAFLRDHLGSWGPLAGEELARMAVHPFYRAIGSLLATWLRGDMAIHAVAAAPLVPPAAGPAERVERDDACPLEMVLS